MCSAAWVTLIGLPSSFPFPIKAPTSSSKSSLFHSLQVGVLPSADTCPLGLRISVPLSTTDEALPWYPTGRWSQFGCNALSGPLNIHPTLKA